MKPIVSELISTPVFPSGKAPHKVIEGKIQLSPKATSRPGPLNLDRSPWLRTIIDCVADPKIGIVCCKMAPQTGKSTAGYLSWGYLMLEDPYPSLFVYTSEDFGKRQVSEKLVSMVKATPELLAMIPNRRYLSDYGIKTDNADSTMIGASGRQNVKGTSAGFVMLDEADEVQLVCDYDVISELRYRLSTYPGSTLFLSSTPVNESLIMEPIYILGSGGYWVLHCTGCGGELELDVKRMEWRKRNCVKCNGKGCKACHNGEVIIPESIYHPCPHCDYKIVEADRYQMNLAGLWKFRNPEIFEIRSFWLPQWYSNDVPWLQICEKARRTKGDKRKLKDYVNNVRAQGWKVKDMTQSQQEETIRALQTRNEGIFDRTSAIYLTVDCQRAKQDHYYAMVLAEEYESERLRLVHYEVCENWQRVQDLWTQEWGGELPDIAIADEGDGARTKHIRSLIDAQEDPTGFYTWKGSGNVQARFKANKEYPERGLIVRESIFKSDTFFRLHELSPEDKGGIELPADCDAELIKQLASVRRKKGAGRTTFESDGNDHFFDCLKMGVFLSEFFVDKRGDEVPEDEADEVRTRNQRLADDM